MSVTNQVLVLFFLMVIGWVARKAKVFDDATVDKFSSFLLNVSLPALIVSSMQKPFSPDLLRESFIVLGISFAAYGACFVLALVFPGLIRAERGSRGIYSYALVFSNVGFMGYPVAEAIFGPEALFHLAIYNIPFNLLAFSVGIWLIARGGERRVPFSWSMLVNPNVIATLVGFLLFLFSVSFPAPLARAVKLTGDVTTPISMLSIGAILGKMDPRSVLGRWRNYAVAAVRLILLPVLAFLVLRAAGARGLLLALPPVVIAMPVAANTTILASVYEGDMETASALVFLTTVLSVLTIPVLATVLVK